jgi:WD40 repeat protein
MVRNLIILLGASPLLFGGAWLVASAQDDKREADINAPTIDPPVRHVLKRQYKGTTFIFSRDGKRFAVNDGTVARVWDTGTWKEVASFTDKAETEFNYVLLSPDGTILAVTCNGIKDIKLFDVASGKLLRTLEGQASIVCPTFSPDGKTLATLDVNDNLLLWDVATAKDMGRFKEKLKDAMKGNSIAFSPDGATLAAPTPGGVLHLLDAKKGVEIRSLAPPDSPIHTPTALAFSPSGQLIAMGSRGQNLVTVWDVRAGKVHCRLKWPVLLKRGMEVRDREFVDPEWRRPRGVSSLAFRSDGRTLFVACEDGWIRAWEVSTWGLRYKLEDAAVTMAIAPGGSLFAISGEKERCLQITICDSRRFTIARPGQGLHNQEALWNELRSSDSALAYEGIRQLVSDSKEALATLDKRLATVDSVEPAVLDRYIQELDDDRFEVRRGAKKRLAELGDVAQPALVRVLEKKPSLEASRQIASLLELLEDPPQGDRLRLIRAVEVLEDIGSPEARRILKRLSGGDPAALLTQQAKAALDRLSLD